ncbi:alpha/beta hydrolase [Bauldia litoralis]|uniref:alpha/beta hydrolase n=1 Tax=Bauldia litoralis TaxID=665467 RepID=UPI0032636D8B
MSVEPATSPLAEASMLDPAYLPFLKAIGPSDPAIVPGEASIADIRAAAARARLPWQRGGATMHTIVEETIATPEGALRMRVYYPSETRPLPTLIYFHGGGWALLDIDTHDRIMREYAAAAGWAVVGVDYPLAPEVRFPDTVPSCVSTIDAVRSRFPRLGLTAPLTLGGDSSGAHLALACAIAMRDAGLPPVDALILNYGVYDGSRAHPSHATFSAPPFTLTGDRMAWFWDLYCPDADRRAEPLASPLHGDLAGLPPIRLVTTGLDILRDENLAMLVRLFEAGNAVSLDHHPHAPHAFLEALAVHPEPMRAIAQTAAWLNAVTGR